MATATKEIQTAARVSGPVRVTIPASVAFDIEKVTTVFRSIGEKVGCSQCYSGADCFLQFERDWLVDPANLKLRGLSGESGGER